MHKIYERFFKCDFKEDLEKACFILDLIKDILLKRDPIIIEKTSSVLEAIHISDKQLILKIEQVENLLYSVRKKLDYIDETTRDMSMELFVFGHIRLVGKDTSIEKIKSISSAYSGKNIYSLLMEIYNIPMFENERMGIEGITSRFIILINYFNKVVEAYSKEFIIKEKEEVLIPDSKIMQIIKILKFK